MAESYFATSEFLKQASRLITTFTLPVNSLAIYLVYYKTPPTMESLKWVLLYSLSWGFLCDLMLGTMCTPLMIIPFCAGSSLGLLEKLGVHTNLQASLTISVIAEVACSIVFIYENSHNHIVSTHTEVRPSKSRLAYFGIHIILSFVFIIPIFFPFPDQEYERTVAMQTMPALIPIFEKHPIFFVTANPLLAGILILSITLLYIVESFYFILHTTYHMFLIAKSHVISDKTKKMQRKYILLILLQTTTQGLVMTTPVTYFVFSMMKSYHNQAINNICMMMLSFHGSTASLATILIYKAYRTEAWNIICKPTEKVLSMIQPSRVAITQVLDQPALSKSKA